MSAALLPLLFLALLPSLRAEEWPQWRGPTGDGVCSEKDLPLRWSRTENVKWRLPLAEPGNSTPILWGSRLFLTQSGAKGQERRLLCLDRMDGHILWERAAPGSDKEESHGTNPYCSASPVTDGERVIAWFGSSGLVCYDFDGRELWRRDLGPQEHIWGYGSSPVLHADHCLLNFGPGARQFLIAVDKRTGKTLWQHAEPGGAKGEKSANWIGSWSTPLIVKSQSGPEVILSWPGRLAAYDLTTGEEHWTCDGLNKLVYTSPVAADGVALGLGGYNGSAVAVRLGGRGNVTSTHRLWLHEKERQRIGSAVVSGGHAYILNDPGVAECVELRTGRVAYAERVDTGKAPAQSWSSMVLSGDRLYALTKAGDTVILRAAPKYEVLAINSLAEPTNASVAVSNGELFLRTHKALWCIRENSGSKP